MYPLRKEYETIVLDKIDELLTQGIIKVGTSRYVSPLVVVKKPHGRGYRMCLDARAINKFIRLPGEKPLTLDEILQTFRGAHYLSSVDLTSSFLQVELMEESKQYAAFRFRDQIYVFNRCPFGFRDSMAALQRALQAALPASICGNVRKYVDDISVATSTFNDHIRVLRVLFNAFRDQGVTVSLEKSELLRHEIRFLGYKISYLGIETDPETLQVIQEFRRPQCSKEVHSFLGFIQFYARFSNKLSVVAEPLRQLIHKGVQFRWGTAQEESFRQIKQIFCERILLLHPDPSKQFHLFVDASDLGLGAELAQN
uniref:RNA-directed DNA polymerase n=1 Tax=Lygus hesperus TaxID=30085 RepID=A0A0A9VR97_LYGHE